MNFYFILLRWPGEYNLFTSFIIKINPILIYGSYITESYLIVGKFIINILKDSKKGNFNKYYKISSINNATNSITYPILTIQGSLFQMI